MRRVGVKWDEMGGRGGMMRVDVRRGEGGGGMWNVGV